MSAHDHHRHDHKAEDHKAGDHGAGGGACCSTHAKAQADAVIRDPVCGMTVDPAKAAATREHDGTTFYFCSASCAQTFDADPHRYDSVIAALRGELAKVAA